MPAHPLPDRFAFGDFVLERSQQRVLHRDGTALELPPRLFGALQLFIDRAGELLHKETLLTALWPGLVVAEAAGLVDPQWPARRRSALAFAGWVSALNEQRGEVAMEHAWREVALCRESGSVFDEAIAFGRVGIAQINAAGQAVVGEARLREAIDRLAAAGRPEAAGHVSYSLTLVLLRRGALDEALQVARRAYRLLRRDGEQALMLGLLPLLAVRRERYEAAARSAGYAAAVYARAGLPSRGLFGEAVARLQEVLPAEAYARLLAEGALLTEEASFALVLEDAG